MNQLIGQFHPAIVHLPIGILCIALVLKLCSLRKDGAKFLSVIPTLLGSALICCIAAAISGYLLSLNGSYESELTNNHMWSGFALTLVCALLYFLTITNYKNNFQSIAWVTSAILLIITGHLGGTITHGEDYLSFSFTNYQKPIIKHVDSALVYHDIIEPILADKCWSCHSSIKQKGTLRLDGLDHILKGGKHGDIINALIDQSKLYHRLTLPKSADEHMPPSGKPQPTQEEIKLIAWWIQSDLTKDRAVYQSNPPFEIKSILSEMTDDIKTKPPPLIPSGNISPIDPLILASINKANITAIPIAQNSNFLQVILRTSSFNSSHWTLLKSIRKNIAWLSARGIKINDTVTNTIASFDHLVKLDLSQSTINDTTIASLNALTMLQSLNLNSTSVTEKGLNAIGNLKSLKSIYTYKSNVNHDALKELNHLFSNCIIDTGNYIVPTFTSDTTAYTYKQLAIDKKDKGQ